MIHSIGNSPLYGDVKLEIYPIRNWYLFPFTEPNILIPIRNISYKELIRFLPLLDYILLTILEIYPIRNWYTTKGIFEFRGILLEIYPIRNWYAFIWGISIIILVIRNISYKELILGWIGALFKYLIIIRNISYKELILHLSTWDNHYLTIRNISYKELIRYDWCQNAVGFEIRNISYKELIQWIRYSIRYQWLIRNISYKELILVILMILGISLGN